MYTMKINCSKNSHFNYILYYNTICELYVNYITNKPNSACCTLCIVQGKPLRYMFNRL